MAARVVTALEHCLLGLIEQGDCSGYDVRRILTRTPMRRFSDSPGSIYPALRRLQRRGWIRATRDRASRRRRTVYDLTAGGKRVLRIWLTAPIDGAEVANRLEEVMLRLSFLHLLGQRATPERFVAALSRVAEHYAEKLRQYIRTSTAAYPLGASLALHAGLNSYQSLARWAAAEAQRRRPPATRRITRTE